MPYERLLQQKRIKAHKANPKEIQALLELADRDLKVAEKTLNLDPDWAYAITYNAILQASRALMFSKGYRPRRSAAHVTVVDFVRETLEREHAGQVNLFDQMRRKRHQVLYDSSGLVGETEATQTLNFARKFVELLSREITSNE